MKGDGKLKQPVNVMLRGGIHLLSQPFVLEPQDSGAEGAPIKYSAYPGEKPILSGGRRIAGWKRVDDGLWSVQLPEVEAGHWDFRQLFVNGRRRQRARIPNEGWFT